MTVVCLLARPDEFLVRNLNSINWIYGDFGEAAFIGEPSHDRFVERALYVNVSTAWVAIMLISSEMPELLGLADRIAVMHEGRVQGILDRFEATQESIMAFALGQI